jgi:uncharacterized protein
VNIDPHLIEIAESQPYPLLFATISGAHLYGFPSPDSDFDLRGVHILPIHEIIGINKRQETIQASTIEGNLELDLVTHDIAKFFGLLLKRNGYVLEQLYSPLIIFSCPEHVELKEIAKGCITRNHAHHYLGFSQTQWKLFEKESPPRVKPLLYVFRVLMTGIYLMRTGQVEANLIHLNENFNLPYIPELIASKLAGREKSTLKETDLDFYRQEYNRLTQILEEAMEKSSLPESPTARNSLNDMLVRIRLNYP